jgi:hypothetical protein
VLARCVALVTLIGDGISNESELVEGLRILPELEDADNLLLYRVARWLRGTYPGQNGRYIGRVEPDLLAERLVMLEALT